MGQNLGELKEELREVWQEAEVDLAQGDTETDAEVDAAKAFASALYWFRKGVKAAGEVVAERETAEAERLLLLALETVEQRG